LIFKSSQKIFPKNIFFRLFRNRIILRTIFSSNSDPKEQLTLDQVRFPKIIALLECDALHLYQSCVPAFTASTNFIVYVTCTIYFQYDSEYRSPRREWQLQTRARDVSLCCSDKGREKNTSTTSACFIC